MVFEISSETMTEHDSQRGDFWDNLFDISKLYFLPFYTLKETWRRSKEKKLTF